MRINSNLPPEERQVQFLAKVKHLFGDKYIPQGIYESGRTQMEWIHNEPDCGATFTSTPEAMFTKAKNKKGCKHCYGKKRDNLSKTIEDLNKELKEKDLLSQFTYIEGFTKYSDECRFKHETCGNENFMISPRALFNRISNAKNHNNLMCPKCANNKTNTIDNFKQEVHDMTNGEYEVVSDVYVNNKHHVEMKHTVCGDVYPVTPNRFTLGDRCPGCHMNLSSGFKRIKKFLTDNNIPFEVEKGFRGLRYKKPLKFDFFCEELALLIEFDGKQHFEGWNGNQGYLDAIRIRDKKKNDYITKQGLYDLVRIPYTEDNIEDVLTEFLKTGNIDPSYLVVQNIYDE